MFSTISFGIDADASGWVAVRAERRWGRVVSETVGAVDADATAGGADFAELCAAISRVSPVRRAVTAAAPAAETIVRRMVAPKMGPARARKVLVSLLDAQLPFRIEDCAVVVSEWRRVGDGTEALAAVIRREALDRRLAELAAMGVAPTALDVEAIAAWDSACREFGEPAPGETRMVVHATLERWVCAVGGDTGLEGAVTVREPPAEAHDAGAWNRADLIFRTASAGRCVERECWIWMGRPAERVALWSQTMAERRGLGLAGRVLISREPETALARTLALRAVEGKLRQTNLLTRDKLPVDVRRARDRVAVLAAGGLIAASVMLVGVEARRISALAQRERDWAAQLERRAREVGGLGRVQRGLEVRMARESVERQLAALAPLDRLFQPPQTASLAGLLRLAGPAQIHLEVVELSDRAVRLEGSAPDRDAARRPEEFLRMLGYEAKTEAGPARPDGRTPFVVEGTRP